MAPLPATRVTTHQYSFAVTGLTSSFLLRSTNFDTKGTESCLPSCAHRGCGIPGDESVSHGIPSIHKHQVAEYISDTALSALDSLLAMRSSSNSKMKQQFLSFYKTLNCIAWERGGARFQINTICFLHLTWQIRNMITRINLSLLSFYSTLDLVVTKPDTAKWHVRKAKLCILETISTSDHPASTSPST